MTLPRIKLENLFEGAYHLLFKTVFVIVKIFCFLLILILLILIIIFHLLWVIVRVASKKSAEFLKSPAILAFEFLHASIILLAALEEEYAS